MWRSPPTRCTPAVYGSVSCERVHLEMLERTGGCSHCSADAHDKNPSATSSAVALEL